MLRLCLTTHFTIRLGLAALLAPLLAHAQDREPPADDTPSTQDAPGLEDLPGQENRNALPGLLSLSLPHPSPSPWALGFSAGAGLFPAVGAMAAASGQLSGGLALGVSPTHFLSARLSMRGSWNLHADGDSSLRGEPSLAVRAHLPLTNDFRLGAEMEARLVGAQAPSIEWAATTPTMRLLGSHRLGDGWLAAWQFGYRLDRSTRALGDVSRLADAERTLLSAGSFDAVELGVGGVHRRGPWEFAAEAGAEVLVGSQAPRLWESPLWLGAGVRYALRSDLRLFGELEASPSGRPAPYPTGFLIPTRPRVSGQVGLIWRPGRGEAQRAEPAPPDHPALSSPARAPQSSQQEISSQQELNTESEASTATISGQVVDEGGRPIVDVELRLVDAEGETQLGYSDANGEFRFEELPLGITTLSATSAGFEDIEQRWKLDASGLENIELSLYQAVPAGQLRGRVQNYQGQALLARIAITPGSPEVELDQDGSFSVDLKPGRYSVRFSAEGYLSQTRTIEIRKKGVVVLNIALEE